MPSTNDSTWDLRLPSLRQELKTAILKAVRKKPSTTRALAATVECNHEQARRVLSALVDEGLIYSKGTTQNRVWHK